MTTETATIAERAFRASLVKTPTLSALKDEHEQNVAATIESASLALLQRAYALGFEAGLAAQTV